MVVVLSFLASYGYFEGGGIGNLLNYWEQLGLFSYMLPFLLIFALVFGILTQTNLFKDNKTINGIIALAVGLMALQFPMVPRFFAEVFPRLGIGLAVILIILILVGMFSDPSKKWLMITFMVIGFIIAVVVLVNTAGMVGLSTGYWWRANWSTILFIGLFLVALAVIVGAGSKTTDKTWNAFWRGESPVPAST